MEFQFNNLDEIKFNIFCDSRYVEISMCEWYGVYLFNAFSRLFYRGHADYRVEMDDSSEPFVFARRRNWVKYDFLNRRSKRAVTSDLIEPLGPPADTVCTPRRPPHSSVCWVTWPRGLVLCCGGAYRLFKLVIVFVMVCASCLWYAASIWVFLWLFVRVSIVWRVILFVRYVASFLHEHVWRRWAACD